MIAEPFFYKKEKLDINVPMDFRSLWTVSVHSNVFDCAALGPKISRGRPKTRRFSCAAIILLYTSAQAGLSKREFDSMIGDSPGRRSKRGNKYQATSSAPIPRRDPGPKFTVPAFQTRKSSLLLFGEPYRFY